MTSSNNSQTGKVVAVCRSAQPGLPKPVVDEIDLREDWGVEGDYHAGKTVRHRYLARKDPHQPNLRQVLLVDAHVFEELDQNGIHIGPGMMGENVTIQHLPLMQLTPGTLLSVGETLLEITEIRIPCKQLNSIDHQLMQAVTKKDRGHKVFQAGMMARILKGGKIKAGDTITIDMHDKPAPKIQVRGIVI